ncbi:MAG: hypothetical protein UV98_C0015G0011, partial [Parcubacteria group bacterium GW2011_GWB1_43_6]
MNKARNSETLRIFDKAGFTIIELLIVIAIIGIITGIIVFNIGAERQNSALLRSAQ